MVFGTMNIDNYSISYNDFRYPGSPTISLESASGNSFGTLIFKPNNEILPGNTTIMTGSPPRQNMNLYYHLDDFQNIIDILRNENPVKLLCSHFAAPPGNPTDIGVGIVTGTEPVGEGEQ